MKNKLVFNQITLENDQLWGGVNYSQIVNADSNLTVGNVACASISFTSEVINLSYINQSCQYYVWMTTDNAYRLVGTFTVLDVVKTRNRYTVTAYDNICKFDSDCYSYLQTLTFPMTVGSLFNSICTHYNCTPYSTTFTNSTFSIETNNFEKGVTGRQVLNYIAEAAGSFIRVDTDGKIKVDWYAEYQTPSQLSAPVIARSSDLDPKLQITEVANAIGYAVTDENGVPYGYFDQYGTFSQNKPKQGFSSNVYTAYEYSDYQTPTIDYVHIGVTKEDTGVHTGNVITNALEILNNPILKISTTNTSAVQGVCDAIYNKVHSITYVPMEARMFGDQNIDAGDIVIIDNNTSYVTEKSWDASGVSFTSKGDSTRESGSLYTQKEKETSGQIATSSGSGMEQRVQALETDVSTIINEYLKSASVNQAGDTLTIKNQSNQYITFQGGGVARFG